MLRPLTDFFFSYTYLRTPGFPSSFFFHPQRNAFLSLPSQSLPRTQSRHPCFTPSPPPRAHFPLPLQYSSASRQHRIPIFLSPSPLRFRCIVTRAMLFPPPLVPSLDTAQRLLWRRPFVPEPRSLFPLSGSPLLPRHPYATLIRPEAEARSILRHAAHHPRRMRGAIPPAGRRRAVAVASLPATSPHRTP